MFKRAGRSACPGLVLSANLCAWGAIPVALKLTGYLGWSWWLVLAPFWIPLAYMLGLLLIGIVLHVAVWLSVWPHR